MVRQLKELYEKTDLGALMRFGMVGITSSITYFLIGLAVERLTPIEPFTANLIAYFSAVSISYFGHHYITFRSTRPHREALPRFIPIMFFVLGSNQLMVLAIVNWWGFDYIWALIANVTMVPPLTYVFSALFAFGAPEKRR